MRIVVLLLSSFCLTVAVDHPPTIEIIANNSHGLTLTSFLFNPQNFYSEWVDHILGSKAVFYSKPSLNGSTFIETRHVNENQLHLRHKEVENAFKFPEYAIIPPCSIEMLGFVPLDIEAPFTRGEKTFNLTIGSGDLNIRNMKWKCFWRPLYENWRTETTIVKAQFWSLVIFCPARTESACERLSDINSGTNTVISNTSLTIYLKKANWTTTFTARVMNQGALLRSLSAYNYPMAMCVIVPYTSSDAIKARANGAMLAEWIRYHIKIGMKVIVYDRDGANIEHLHNTPYMRAQGIGDLDFVYYNYTIRGLLDPGQSGFKYDNTERVGADALELRYRYESQGHDKTLTFTQCRFEAKAMFGIDTVVAADFDEFLLCPRAAPDPEAQNDYLAQFFADARRLRVDQVMFAQRLMLNKTDSPRDCIVNQVSKSESLFDCFASHEFFISGHSIKSAHLGLKCPLTGYHQACSSETAPQAFNCVCNNLYARPDLGRMNDFSLIYRGCVLAHLSTLPSQYKEWTRHDANSVARARKEKSELWTVAHSNKTRAPKLLMSDSGRHGHHHSNHGHKHSDKHPEKHVDKHLRKQET